MSNQFPFTHHRFSVCITSARGQITFQGAADYGQLMQLIGEHAFSADRIVHNSADCVFKFTERFQTASGGYSERTITLEYERIV